MLKDILRIMLLKKYEADIQTAVMCSICTVCLDLKLFMSPHHGCALLSQF